MEQSVQNPKPLSRPPRPDEQERLLLEAFEQSRAWLHRIEGLLLNPEHRRTVLLYANSLERLQEDWQRSNAPRAPQPPPMCIDGYSID